MLASLPFSFSFGPKLLSSALVIWLFFQNPYPSSSVLNSSFPKPPPPFIHAFDRISSLTHSLTHFLAWVLAWPTTDWQHVVVVAEDYIILLPSSFSSTAMLGTSQVQLHQDSITTSKFSLIVLFPWVVYSLSLSLPHLFHLFMGPWDHVFYFAVPSTSFKCDNIQFWCTTLSFLNTHDHHLYSQSRTSTYSWKQDFCHFFFLHTGPLEHPCPCCYRIAFAPPPYGLGSCETISYPFSSFFLSWSFECPRVASWILTLPHPHRPPLLLSPVVYLHLIELSCKVCGPLCPL